MYGVSSNYWDSLNFFGWNSAYENVLFYQSVLAMSDIENYLGNAEDAAYYTDVAARVKKVFNETFWDGTKGRYITSINKKGDVLDFGLTFVNFMAASAGLADERQLEKIYSWVDGERVIDGDTSKGADIYNFKVSARSNTVAVETIEEDGLHYWWYNGHSFNDVLPGMWGEYGLQMQNGGTIFYTSYYDISGRTGISGDNAMKRFNVIMDEFHKDQLRRDPRTSSGFTGEHQRRVSRERSGAHDLRHGHRRYNARAFGAQDRRLSAFGHELCGSEFLRVRQSDILDRGQQDDSRAGGVLKERKILRQAPCRKNLVYHARK